MIDLPSTKNKFKYLILIVILFTTGTLIFLVIPIILKSFTNTSMITIFKQLQSSEIPLNIN